MNHSLQDRSNLWDARPNLWVMFLFSSEEDILFLTFDVALQKGCFVVQSASHSRPIVESFYITSAKRRTGIGLKHCVSFQIS